MNGRVKILYAVNTLLALVLLYILIAPQLRERGRVEGNILVARSLGALPVWVAQEKGFFDSAGVQVTVDMSVRRAEEVDAVANGNAQFGAGTIWLSFVPATLRRPLAYRFFAFTESTVDRPVTALMVATDRRGRPRFRSLKALEGKRIGYWRLTKDGDLLRTILEKEGLDVRSFVFLPFSLKDLARAFEEGKVDAAVVYEPVRSYLLATRKAAVLEDGFLEKRVGSPFFLDLVYTSQLNLTLGDKRRATIRMGQAINRAIQYIRQHPDEARTIAWNHLFEGDTTLTPPESFSLPAFVTLEEVSPAQLRASIDQMKALNLIFVDYPVDSLFPPAELFRAR